jgi:SAM-dependent methyltransferase
VVERDEGFEALLSEIAALAAREGTELAELFEVYAAEARFGRRWLAPSLAGLAPNAAILEVGAGALILATALQRAGYRVTALEPLDQGFKLFERLQRLVLEVADRRQCRPVLLTVPAEALAERDEFDFAYSINVMEHVGDPDACIAAVLRALRPGALYRFTCANYLFPYEPHFNIPTLFDKALTYRVFGAWIRGTARLVDPLGVWNSLNWINVARVRRIAARCGAPASFGRTMFAEALRRTLSDPQFARRRAGLAGVLARGLVKLGLDRLAPLVPVLFQPLIDCTLVRQGRQP